MKVAIVLFNLGGPDSLDAVEPFLENLFSDPAIISLPSLVRRPLARLIARRRAPVARAIYQKIGDRSPILEETEAQGRALEVAMSEQGIEAKAFVAMRAWKPFASEAARAVAAWQPEQIVLLPLYPQFSTTTTGSSVENWRKEAKRMDLKAPQTRVCCYPDEPGFVASVTALISETFARRRPGVDYRLLLSAHGLPKRTISKGDPYQWQVEKTAAAVVDALGIPDLDWRLCYQSRVGPLQWIGPATDAEIRCAGSEGKGIVLAPVAFVSEHSETLVELDIEYAKLALESDVPHFLRVPTAGTHPTFIQGLTAMVVRALDGTPVVTCGAGRLCPQRAVRCGYEDIHA